MLSSLIFGDSKKIYLLDVFLDNINKELTLSELSDLSFASANTIRNYLRDFDKEGILIRRKYENKTKYKLNLRDKRIKALYSFWVNDEEIVRNSIKKSKSLYTKKNIT